MHLTNCIGLMPYIEELRKMSHIQPNLDNRLLSVYCGIFVTDILLEATCVMAYFGFLRCGEFTILHSFDPECNVCMEDVHFHNDRVTLHLKASKTDPFREGVDIHLFSSGASVCPVISLNFEIKHLKGIMIKNHSL